MNENQQALRARSDELSLWSVMRLLLSKIHWLLLAGAVLGLCVYLVTVLFITPTYESRVSFYVYNTSDSTSRPGTINNNDLQAAESLAETYSKILQSNSVLDAVLSDIGSGMARKDLGEMVSVSVVSGTQLLEVVITSTDANFACQVANSFAKVAPTEIVRITKAGGVEVVDRPEVATEKASPRTLFNTAVGFAAGVVLFAIVLILRTLSDRTIYLPEDLDEMVGATILGQIPEILAQDSAYTYWKLEKGETVYYEDKHETEKTKA